MPQFHPLANAFPLLTGEAFEELTKDIKEHGLSEPVIMLDGMILDGRNRWRACQELGIAHREVKFGDLKLGSDDPAAFVWSKNAVRRQLTPSQKALAATKLVTAKSGDNRRTVADKVTTAKAAKMAGVGERSVHRAKRVIENATPEVVAAVEAGDLALEPAETLAKKPVEIQKKIMSENDPKEVAKAVTIDRTPSTRKPVTDGPGRGNVGPKVTMTRQMEGSSAEGSKARTRFWAENKELIKDLDAELLDQFVKDLGAERRAIEQLLKLIRIERESAKPAGTTTAATPSSPAAKKTAAPRRTAAKKAAEETKETTK